MAVEIDVFDNLDNLDVWLKELGQKGLVSATKSSFIRTRPTMKRESMLMVKRFRKAKSKAITDRFKFINKLGGTRIDDLSVELDVKRKPIRALEFIKGKKEAQKRAGISPRKRRRLKIEVVPGRVRKLPRAFIDRGRGGKLMVLERKGKERRPLRRRPGAYIHSLFAQERLTKPIEKPIGEMAAKQFASAVQNKMKNKKPR